MNFAFTLQSGTNVVIIRFEIGIVHGRISRVDSIQQNHVVGVGLHLDNILDNFLGQEPIGQCHIFSEKLEITKSLMEISEGESKLKNSTLLPSI